MVTPEFYNYKVYDYGSEIQIRLYEKPMSKGSKRKNKSEIKKSEIDFSSTIEDYEEGFNRGDYDINDLFNFCNGFNNDKSRSALLSANRSKNKVYEYSRANDWEWFVTLTFDPSKVDSTDYDLLSEKVSQWLKNIKRDYASDLKYILVPELHDSNDSMVYCNACDSSFKKKEKKCHECGSDDFRNAFHFHALMSNLGTMTLVDSGKRLKSGKIFNLGNYKLGWTTATKIHDSKKASNYLSKYITKTLCEFIPNRKKYWSSRNLEKPVITTMMLSEDELKKLLESISTQVVNRSVVDVDLPEYKNKITYLELRL